MVTLFEPQDVQWPIVRQAPPTKIKHHPVRRPPKDSTLWKRAVIFPDPQIGFRHFEDGERDPYHDPEAIDVALQILSHVQETSGVDLLIHLGDFLDLPGQGRFLGEASFAQTTQASIDYGHGFLATCVATAPDATHVLIEGNHDKRLAHNIQINALASFGLKRAQMPDSWPVLSLPHLLRLEELGVIYVDAWPNGKYWINDRLFARHGDKVRSGSSTANVYVKDTPHLSQIFGHVHRIELHYKSVMSYDEPIRSVAASPGCLCRVDGAVPSYGSSIQMDGRPAARVEDWQQGVMIVDYHEDGRFALTPVHIVDGWAFYDGREFRSW